MSGRCKNKIFFIIMSAFLIVSGLGFSNISKLSAAEFIAGVEPGMRRTDIPVITQIKRDPNWQKNALSGISAPTPQHVLNFLKDQGEWFSPFLHPGMSAPYDIRGWHKKSGK